MKYEQSIKDIYMIAGMLEALSIMAGETITITPGLAADLEDAVDKLELIGAELNNQYIEAIGYDLVGQMKLKGLFDHEGTEESPPAPQPPDQ